MATATKSYSFTALTTAEAAKVNQNFDDLLTFLNGSVIHKDGTVAFTGAPSYAADPVSDSQLARKLYVDAQIPVVAPKVQFVPAALTGTPVIGTSPFKIVAGTAVVTCDATGLATLNYGYTFPTGLVTVLVSNGDTSAGGGISVGVSGTWTTSSCQIKAWTSTVTAPYGTYGNNVYVGAFRANFIAIGW